ncbi:YeiH family protein [Clostridium folliculivorans]|uniref:Sulfate exporter family transporter n=1 Tax=Clostridium folliculivorans TaxID=2886038 RepID=A0A9W5Y2V3_9CLOT|nr:YeiH family protein [Clostridium folliculivorans]GKU25538.1 hypothetical protein CFOLD11_23640 [Clostridium folliculivorans]GKU28561.1 hypothetical protein CFB3_06670 [Clostridium folliculivorans]
MNWLKKNLQGIVFSFIIALVSNLLGYKFPIIGGAVFGIVIGIIINNIFNIPEKNSAGIDFTSKKILQWSIIILGAGLSLRQVWYTGTESVYVMFFTLLTAFVTAFIFGKLLKIPWKLKSLIAVGTAICGGSAIASISPIIEADDNEVSYSISTIFLFNILAVLIFPPLGHILKLSNKAFGLWAGTAINDTSSVVAAGYAFSNIAGEYATIVKLTRTTIIIPISIMFSIVMAIQKKKSSNADISVNFNLSKIFPWFILWFLVASLLNTLGFFSEHYIKYINSVGKFMIVMALSAVGLKSDLKKIISSGFKPMLLGLIVWLSVSTVSLVVQAFTHQL